MLPGYVVLLKSILFWSVHNVKKFIMLYNWKNFLLFKSQIFCAEALVVLCTVFILKNKNFQVMSTLLDQMRQYPG